MTVKNEVQNYEMGGAKKSNPQIPQNCYPDFLCVWMLLSSYSHLALVRFGWVGICHIFICAFWTTIIISAQFYLVTWTLQWLCSVCQIVYGFSFRLLYIALFSSPLTLYRVCSHFQKSKAHTHTLPTHLRYNLYIYFIAMCEFVSDDIWDCFWWFGFCALFSFSHCVHSTINLFISHTIQLV